MKVLLMHQQGHTHGSGGLTAMFRLHQQLRRDGVTSVIACRKNSGTLPADEVVELPRADFAENMLGTLTWRLGLNDVHCVSAHKIKRWKPFLDADVMNIHGAHTNFFSYLALPGMTRRRPVVCTMHDMWHLTGHCSQSYECNRWRTGCGRCPHLDTYPPVSRDATAWEWKLKRRAYRKADLTFVVPSRWLLDIARQGMLAHADVRQIPNAVDTEVYTPRDRRECRTKLGIPPDKRVIMFISVAIHAKAKGGDLLAAALASLPDAIKRDSVLLLMGEKSESFGQSVRIDSHALGYVHEDAQKALAYAAADVVVQPSRAENQSLVILEAMACGTPIVAFDVGGNAELVNDGPSGHIVPQEDAQAMSAAIGAILSEPARAAILGSQARRAIVRTYSLRSHSRAYQELYREKIASHPRSRATASAT